MPELSSVPGNSADAAAGMVDRRRGETAARQFRLLVGAKLVSGLIGMAWLVLLTRMPPEQLGIYFAVVALAEIAQHASSAGVNVYAERFLPADWLNGSRLQLRRTLLRLVAWRSVTLGAVAWAVALFGPALIGLIEGPADPPLPWLCAAFIASEGMYRFAELVLNAALMQGWCQMLTALKNLARLAVVAAWAGQPGQAMSAAEVLAVEVALGCVFTVVLVLTAHRAAARIRLVSETAGTSRPWRQRLVYSLHGYGSLVLERLTGLDTLKLIVAHAAGPASLAVFGLALALVDLVARYMPMALFWGFFRMQLTAKLETGTPRPSLLRQAQAMALVNAAFVLAVAPWMVLFGASVFTSAATAADADAVRLGVAAMAGVPLMLSLRMLGSLLTHLDRDGGIQLRASASTLMVPVLVWALVPAWGAVASAVLGWWLLEALPTMVLWRGRGQQLVQLLGGARFWLGVCLAGCAAAAGSLAAKLSMAGALGLGVAACLYWLIFGLALFWLHAAGGLKPLRLNRLRETVFGWPER